MENACVLMSTYNGRKYINEQIESILNQNYDGKILILIRDDGSSDDTIEKIHSISCSDNREIRILNSDCNVGPQRSFLKLIDSAPQADYYFFSDQDDVWKIDHIYSAVKKLDSVSTPALYCSNYSLVDSKLQLLSPKEIASKPQFTPLKAFFYNEIPGCCMAWNFALQKYLLQMHPSNVMMHDRYVLSFACFIGDVLYDPDSHILHRIHGENVIGTGHKKIQPRRWIADKAKLISHKENYDVSEMASEFLRVAEDNAKREFVEDIMILKNYKQSRAYTHKLLKHPDTKNQTIDRTTISIRSRIFFQII